MTPDKKVIAWILRAAIGSVALAGTISSLSFRLDRIAGAYSFCQIRYAEKQKGRGTIPPGASIARAGRLRLDLSAEKTEVIRGESIPFELALTNLGNEPVTLEDESPSNRAFSIRVTGKGSFSESGDAMSVAMREGERVEPPRRPALTTLAPNGRMVVRGDVIAWVGELEPGGYSIVGAYGASPALRAASREAAIRVGEAAPVWARTAKQNLFLAHEPRDAAWLHRSAAGFELFLMRSSPRNPQVIYSNRRLASLTTAVEPIPSSYNTAPPRVQHVVWTQPDGSLRIIRLPGNAPPEGPFTVPLPAKNLKPVETPFSDEEGTLHIVLANPDGNAAGLFQIPEKEAPAYHAFGLTSPIGSPRSVHWYKDGVLIFAWASPDAREVWALTSQLKPVPRATAPRRIFSADQPIIDLSLTQRYDLAKEKYNRLLIALCRDGTRERLLVKRMDVGAGRVELEQQVDVPGAGALTFLHSVLKDDLTPVYLFSLPDGSLTVASPGLSGSRPLLDSAGKPIGKESFPALVIPTGFSRMPGIYLRYIEAGRRFSYAKVGS